VPEKIIHCKVIKLIIIFSSQLRYLFRSCLYTQIFKTNINLWSSTFQAFFPRRYLSIILLYLYNIMPNITYISCSVWLFCNTIAIHLLKKKNSCDHLSLNTYKSLLRTIFARQGLRFGSPFSDSVPPFLLERRGTRIVTLG
jgi:hypothetical protein